MKIATTVDCPIHDSFRVSQLAGMFDVAIESRMHKTFSVEIPGEEEDWKIGAIIGPSGSGKSTVARHAFGNDLWQSEMTPWSDDAVIDNFKASVKDTTGVLTAVGFSTPPSWIKPFKVLSNGEKFRCDLARALLDEKPLIVYDEFTSFLDRTVAKVASSAVSKAIRTDRVKKRFVAVTCHSDIIDWLQPDWVLDMASSTLARGLVRPRPEINLQLHPASTAESWPMFKQHHYLDGGIHKGTQSFVATWDGKIVAYCGLLANFGHFNSWRITRIVVLPDFQGVGIGSAVMEATCKYWRTQRKDVRLSIVSTHPGIRNHCLKSPNWKLTTFDKYGKSRGTAGKHTGHVKPLAVSHGRSVTSFEYVGE